MSFNLKLFGLNFSIDLHASQIWSLGVAADVAFKPFFISLRLSLIAPYDVVIGIEKAESDAVA